MAGLLDRMKSDIKKVGSNKSKFIYFRPDTKVRIRFLQDMDDGMEIIFHDSFEKSVNIPCQEVFGRSCIYCEDDELRTRAQYCWNVWDYEAKEVKLFMFAVNNFTPIPALMAMYENYGTITDRDYVISVSGKGISKSYSVIPMDKVKLRNNKAKPYSDEMVLKMLDKAFPPDSGDNQDDDESQRRSTRKKAQPTKGQWSEEEERLPKIEDLEKMKPQKLYNLCRERDIDVAPKKSVDYYVDILEDWKLDHEEDCEDDYDDEQDWGDEETSDYTEMSAKELYALCKERKIEVEPKKVAKYYIKQLEEYDNAQNDWGDEEEDDDVWDDWEDEE